MLLSTLYRGLVRNEAAWDLLALVIGGGFIATLYQARHRVLSRQWAVASAVAVVVAVVVSIAFALAMR